MLAAATAALLATLAPSSVTAAPADPAASAAVARAVVWLKQRVAQMQPGRSSLAAYALLKAEQPPSTPEVQQAIAEVRSQIQSGKYARRDHYVTYIAAVDLMLLEAADPVAFRGEIESIAAFLVETQRSGGYWEYPNTDRGGDTSQTQYALLGLWAAHRAGVVTPAQTWDRAARWLMASQLTDGGSAYTPGDTTNRDVRRVGSSYTMTTATIGSLALVRRMLHPGGKQAVEPDRPPPEPDRKFGVLQRLDITTEAEQTRLAAANATPEVSVADLNAGIRRGMGWYAPRYRIGGVPDHQLYYLYGLERTAALADLDTIAGHDWYAEGIDYLVKNQKADGSWDGGPSRDEAGTAFGVLFIMRATSKLLGRGLPRPEMLGSGLLKGGRGLPSDLGQALVADGKVQAREITDPIEKLLSQLERQDAPHVEAVQQAIVESVQLGNREELIGQKERLVRLVGHPNAEVRRTALWALGRSDDLKLVKLLVRSLQDPDLGVRIEAHNALCALSRRPNGFENLPNDPLDGVPQDASDQDRQAAIDRWSRAVYDRWHAWYLSVRPYDERDDLQEPMSGLRRR